DRLWLFTDCEQLRQRWPVNVGIEHADLYAEVAQAERQIDRRRRFPGTTLPRRNCNDRVDAGYARLYLVSWMGGPRSALSNRPLRLATRSSTALGGQCNERRLHTRNCANSVLCGFADSLPGLHRGCVDRQ